MQLHPPLDYYTLQKATGLPTALNTASSKNVPNHKAQPRSNLHLAVLQTVRRGLSNGESMEWRYLRGDSLPAIVLLHSAKRSRESYEIAQLMVDDEGRA